MLPNFLQSAKNSGSVSRTTVAASILRDGECHLHQIANLFPKADCFVFKPERAVSFAAIISLLTAQPF